MIHESMSGVVDVREHVSRLIGSGFKAGLDQRSGWSCLQRRIELTWEWSRPCTQTQVERFPTWTPRRLSYWFVICFSHSTRRILTFVHLSPDMERCHAVPSRAFWNGTCRVDASLYSLRLGMRGRRSLC